MLKVFQCFCRQLQTCTVTSTCCLYNLLIDFYICYILGNGSDCGKVWISIQDPISRCQNCVLHLTSMTNVIFSHLQRIFVFAEINLDASNFPGVKMRPKASTHPYDSREGSVSGQSGDSSPIATGSFPRRGLTNGASESAGFLEELEKER